MEQHSMVNRITEKDLRYMEQALNEAKLSAERGEVPVGALIVWEEPDGTERVVACSGNGRENEKNALAHAECKAINEACRTLKGWRLHRARMYVTLEPCPMCAGAIVNARIKTVFFGAKDEKGGAFGSVMDMNLFKLNHHPTVVSGVMESECAALLSDFFRSRRKKSKSEEE